MHNETFATAGTPALAGPGLQKIKVLIVDDSVVIRHLMTRIIEEDALLQVVGTARNGLVALEKIEQLQPDVVTMDVEMPEMDGIETLRRVRSRFPAVKVIMFSTLTQRGTAATVSALILGACDYVSKPSNEGPAEAILARLRSELIPKIKNLFPGRRAPHAALVPSVPDRPATSLRPLLLVRKAPQAVVIGVSTGGPAALAAIMPTFPADFPLPIYIVQHMPPMFTALLAQQLNRQSQIEVREAAEGMVPSRGVAFVAAGNYHMKLVRKDQQIVITLNQDAPVNSCRPSVDVLFQSAHELYEGNLVAVVLTGMGQDGLRGSEQIKNAGGYVIAQDNASSVVWGMPGAVANAGLADAVLDLEKIVPDILRQVRLA